MLITVGNVCKEDVEEYWRLSATTWEKYCNSGSNKPDIGPLKISCVSTKLRDAVRCLKRKLINAFHKDVKEVGHHLHDRENSFHFLANMCYISRNLTALELLALPK